MGSLLETENLETLETQADSAQIKHDSDLEELYGLLYDLPREKGLELEIQKDFLNAIDLLKDPKYIIENVKAVKERLVEELYAKPNDQKVLIEYEELSFIEAYISNGDLSPYVKSVATVVSEATELVSQVGTEADPSPSEVKFILSKIRENRTQISRKLLSPHFLSLPGDSNFEILNTALTSEIAGKLFKNKAFLTYALLSTGINVVVPNAAMGALPAALVKYGYPELAATYVVVEGVLTLIPVLPGLPGYVRGVMFGLIEGTLSYIRSGFKKPNYKLTDSLLHGVLPMVDGGWTGIPFAIALREMGMPVTPGSIKALLTAVTIGLPIVRLQKKYLNKK